MNLGYRYVIGYLPLPYHHTASNHDNSSQVAATGAT